MQQKTKNTVCREELAWAAGFFDGEGHTTVYPDKGKYLQIKIQIAQIDRQVLDRFQNAVLGLGYINGPYYSKQSNKKPEYRFCAGSFEHVQAIIAMLYGFLSPVKQEQCLQVLKRYQEYKQR